MPTIRFGPCKACGERVMRRGRTVLNPTGTPLNHDLSCAAKGTQMTTTAADPFGPPETPRDRWGRPLIIPPDGGKPVAYTRCTTYVGCLEDTFNLAKWQQRMVALGLAKRPDLLLSVSAHGDDKKVLNGICDEAREAAAASAAATTGTALHKIAERLDRGEDFDIPAAYQDDLYAYAAKIRLFDVVHAETLTVQDSLRVAGTPDRVLAPKGGGRAFIADIKTGSLDFGVGKIAMQLALYAHSRLYDVATGARTDLDVDLDRALIIHLPAGHGECNLVWVDIAAGWEAVQLATKVREWRARKDLTTPYVLEQTVDPLTDLIGQASDEVELRALWALHKETWTAAHTAAAAARKQTFDVAA